MWALLNSDEDTIVEIINNPKSMTIDGIQHPRGIFNLWTVAERKAIRLVPVTTTGSHLDGTYYTEDNESYAIENDKASVVRTIGVKAADRALADVDDVDENGDPFLDDHDNQTVTLGLKSQAKNKANIAANGYIKGFDWLVQRKVTHDTDIPSDILTYIAAVRTAHASICTAIDNASDMAAFIALHVSIYNDDYTLKTIAKVQDWPDDYGVKGSRRQMATDAIEMGKLIQAVQTLSKDVDRLSKRLDSLESQLDKGKGLFIGILLVASGAGAAISTIMNKWF